MQSASFVHHYSSKTDDELLALAADPDSLVDEARSALVSELQRRKLSPFQQSGPRTETAPPVQASASVVRAKWVGLWLLSTLIATLGVLITVGILTTAVRPFTSRAIRYRLVETPYPIPILVGLLQGYFSYLRFKGSYRYWVWIGPALLTLFSIIAWKSEHQLPWPDVAFHFFGYVPYPDNGDQMNTSLILYTSAAYSLAAFAQARRTRLDS